MHVSFTLLNVRPVLRSTSQISFRKWKHIILFMEPIIIFVNVVHDGKKEDSILSNVKSTVCVFFLFPPGVS